jgi:hypothetical protein
MQSLFVVVLILAALAAAYYLLGRQVPGITPQQSGITLPINLKELIPATWTVLPNQFYHCDFDGDQQPEWLVLYRYDQTSPSAAFQPGKAVTRGAIGAVVYDLEVNQVRQNLGSPSPFRPVSLFPYKLLPDIFPGKGQGFLGESSVTLGFSPAYQANSDKCSVNEIAVFGYSDGSFPTRLSVFHWDNPSVGYLVRHFVGNARIEVTPDPSLSQPTTAVRTYNRLNDRSQLCELHDYKRTTTDILNFVEDPNRVTIGFCFDAPLDPAYPEGAVLAELRGANPNDGGNNATPTGNSFLAQAATNSLPAELNRLKDPKRDGFRVLSVENPAALTAYPSAGTVISDTLTNQYWVWSQERVAITTTVVLESGTRSVAWEVVSVANELKAADIHWRIERVSLR